MKILEFTTLQKAESGLSEINIIMVDHYRDLGFDIVNDEIIGKNSLTGESRPDAQHTTSFAIIEESPDNTFHMPSTDDMPYAVDETTIIPSADFSKKDRPPSWDNLAE